MFFSSLKREITRGILGKETQPAQNGIESAEIMLYGLWGSLGVELAKRRLARAVLLGAVAREQPDRSRSEVLTGMCSDTGAAAINPNANQL